MTIGPEPMIRIFSMSVLLGICPPFAGLKEPVALDGWSAAIAQQFPVNVIR
jgi:hypothetical protein